MNQLWKLTVFNKDVLILEHTQNDFGKVLRFGVNSLVELMNQSITDFRLIIQDKEGNVYFYSIGPTTQIVGLKKMGTPIPKDETIDPNYVQMNEDIYKMFERMSGGFKP